MNKRKNILLFMMIFTLIVFAGCTSNEETQVTEDTFLVLIDDLDIEGRMLKVDKIEWIDMEDTERIEELEMDENDFPNGFYIYNESEDIETFEIAEDPNINIVNWEKLDSPIETDLEGLYERAINYPSPYHIKTLNGKVVEIREQYTP